MADQDKDLPPNFADMTDDEMRNFDPSTLDRFDAPVVADTEVVVEGEEGTDVNVAPAVVVDTVVEDTTKDSDILSAEDDKEIPVAKEAVAPAKEDPATVVEPVAVSEADKPAELDYKAMYEKITAPFKANGRDIQIKTPEDAVALMQMGANYNKKMAGLKPNLKIMKMLEANGLLSEEKLSYLIDLDKKDPNAINKLVKESGIDPLDLSAEKAGEYRPKTYTVDEREMELDEVLGELESSPHYTRTLEVVSNKWDGASKSVIASQPEILKVINAHMGNGIYDMIHSEMESEKTFGRLKGLSDLEAYRQVGDSIQARGGFAHLGHQKEETPAPVIVAPKPKAAPVNEEALRDKKRAASSTKAALPSLGVKEDYNPLNMSDEEFLKASKPQFN